MSVRGAAEGVECGKQHRKHHQDRVGGVATWETTSSLRNSVPRAARDGNDEEHGIKEVTR